MEAFANVDRWMTSQGRFVCQVIAVVWSGLFREMCWHHVWHLKSCSPMCSCRNGMKKMIRFKVLAPRLRPPGGAPA
jgi:hypothetical protein